MNDIFKAIHRKTRQGGRFIFSVPHPCFWNSYKHFIPENEFNYMTTIERTVDLTITLDPLRPITHAGGPTSPMALVRIAILDQFSAPLCQAVTGSRSSRQHLDSMEARQVLLTALDQDRHWYRYHPLLGGYLHQRLEAELGDEIPKLHRRAYRWYASHQLWTDAIRHAIAAGDAEEAQSWIEHCAMDLVKKGDLLTLLAWQRLFPIKLMRSQLKVGFAIAWGLALAMRFEEALHLVAKIDREVDNMDAGETDAMRCESQAIHAVVTALRDDSQAALPLAENCLRQSTDPWTAPF